ncbi:MAG: YjgP/YjgQ family permease [Opitutae bacterium]|nr:YjgP/YjgQ family permease [Opitutae bacterium]
MNSPIIIRRFVFLELLTTTLLATIVLTGVLLYGNAVRSHESLFQALSLSPGLFLELIGFLVPYSMTYGIPFGFALAVLLCFGRWSSDKEILALRSLGLGIWDWGKPVFSLSILLSALCLYANLQWAPVNRSHFDQKMEEVLWTNLNAVLEKEGEIEFSIGDDLNEESGASLQALGGSELSKVSISVGEVRDKEWENLRILLFGEAGDLLSIVHAKRGIVEKSEEKARILLELRDIDVESGDSAREGKSSDLFVSFERWNQPLVLDLDAGEQTRSYKRMGFRQLWAFSRESEDKGQKIEARSLLNKNFALGLSPFFLSLILLPLAVTKGRKESVSNMALGIFAAVSYYGIGNLFANSASPAVLLTFGWWGPNAICLCLGLPLLLRFEST